MSFIAPLFFVALAGLAIPVLIHLIQREKKQIIRFPSLMFVQRVPYKSVQRRRIHNWLLLMVRLAALALIILAFARPFFAAPADDRRRAPARAKWSCCSIRATASATAIAGSARAPRPTTPSTASARPIAARWCCSRRAPRSRCSRPARPTARALNGGGCRGQADAGCDALRAGAQGGRQHPGRVAAAAARGGADQRLPARRVARRGRRAAAGGHDADAGRRSAAASTRRTCR